MRKEALFSLLVILLVIGLASADCYHCDGFNSPCSSSVIDCIDDTPDNVQEYTQDSNCFCSSSSPPSVEWDNSVCKADYNFRVKRLDNPPYSEKLFISHWSGGYQVNRAACSPCKGERGVFNRLLVSNMDYEGGRKEEYAGECICPYGFNDPEYTGCYVYVTNSGYYQCSYGERRSPITNTNLPDEGIVYRGFEAYYHLIVTNQKNYLYLNGMYYKSACRPVYDCEPPACPGDVDGDGKVDVNDLIALGEDWLCDEDGCYGDLNCDGITNLADFAELSANWLKECN